jgi:hypothetical protein
LSGIDWDLLLRRIKAGECTPFLGAGASADVLPLGRDVAEKWATQRGYPFADSHDLIRVAQYRAVMAGDSVLPKEEMISELQQCQLPDFSKPDQPHRILASLPLPVYLTTNYDNFMTQALGQKPNPNKAPQEVMCRWNSQLKREKSIFEDDPNYVPTPEKPVVFHLHGHWKKAASLVLTEDDYLDFLRESSRNEMLLPPRIQEALADSSLLFIGYAITDWNFRVLFRTLVEYLEKSQRRTQFSVQLEPGRETDTQEQKEKALEYMQKYFGDLKIKVYWGTCQNFLAELSERWEAARGN